MLASFAYQKFFSAAGTEEKRIQIMKRLNNFLAALFYGLAFFCLASP